jgi:hypothetical protein
MELFHYRDGQLYCENLSVAEITEGYDTPLYLSTARMPSWERSTR